MDIASTIARVAAMVPGFLIALVFHEFAHAYAAHLFGDDTAKNMGRMTLNPIPHLDPIGTILFPLAGAISGFAMFGWAKPVPIDARYFKDYRKAIFFVAFAGPLMNIFLMFIFAFLASFCAFYFGMDFLQGPFGQMMVGAVTINIVLAVFNLIPFPPLDGSRMVSSFLSYENAYKYNALQQYAFIFLLLLWFTPLLRMVMNPAINFGFYLMNTFYALLH